MVAALVVAAFVVAAFVVVAIGSVAAANIAGAVQESNLLKALRLVLKLDVARVAWVAWVALGSPDVSLRQIWKPNYS